MSSYLSDMEQLSILDLLEQDNPLPTNIKLLSLFSGIGAFEKALDRLGINYELVNYCEIDKYASRSYAAIHGVSEDMNLWDVTKVDEKALPKDIDLITYGFPCQDISLAGKQKGLFNEDGSKTRSGLFFDALRIIEETKPRVAIAENVKNLVGKKFNAQFQVVLASLEAAGYNNYWAVLNSKDFGIPQNRERVFIVSIRKDIDKGYTFPKGFPLEKRLKDVLEETVDEKYYLSSKGLDYILAPKRQGKYTQILNRESEATGCAITAVGNANWTGNFIEEPRVNVVGRINSSQDGVVVSSEGIAPTHTAGHGDSPKIVEPFISIDEGSVKVREATKRGYDEIEEPQVLRQVRTEYGKKVRKAYESGETQEKWGNMRQFEPRTDGVANTLSTVQKDNYVAVAMRGRYDETRHLEQQVAQTLNTMPQQAVVEPMAYDEQNKYIRQDGCVGTLTTDGSSPKHNNRVVENNLRIRKLTPLETWRLMGFDDSDFHKSELVNSNSQLYKQAGNSIVVDVLECILKQIFKAI